MTTEHKENLVDFWVRTAFTEVKNHQTHQKMLENINNSNQGNLRRSHLPSHKASRKVQGDHLANILAKFKPLTNKSIKEYNEFELFDDLLRACDRLEIKAQVKLTPNRSNISEKFNSGEWFRVDFEKLGVTYYREGSDNFHRFHRFYRLGLMHRLHRVHQSVEEPGKIAYYPTFRHFKEGREVRTKLGKYLTTYKDSLNLSEQEIKTMAENYAANLEAQKGWKVSFIESNDPDGWVRVYQEGPDSCMSRGKAGSCVQVYAHKKSVLRLAYVQYEGDIVARAIVREDDEKGYLRVYPDPEGTKEGRFLLSELGKLGYSEEINLDGVLLACVEDSGGYVCPYIDTGSGGEQYLEVTYLEGKSYLELGSGSIGCSNQSGTTDCDNREECDCCGDSVDATTWVESSEESVCEGCLGGNYTLAYGRSYEEYFRDDDVIYCETNGNHYAYQYTSDHDIYRCEVTDNWYHIDDLVATKKGWIHVDESVGLDHEDDEGNQWADKEDSKTLMDGKVCHEDDFERLEEELITLAAEAEEEALLQTLPTIPTKTEARAELLEA